MKVGILGWILGRTDGAERAVLREAFGFLDSVERGLADKAIGYVESGEGRPVLSTLAAKQTEIAQALHGPQGRPSVRPMPPKLGTMVWGCAGRAPWLARLAEVLALTRERSHWAPPGSSGKIPEAVRVLWSQMQRHATEADPARRTRPADVLEAAGTLGASRADLAELLHGYRYSSIPHGFPDKLALQRELLSMDLADLREALSRLDATGRESLLTAMGSSGAEIAGDLVPFLFDLCEETSAKVRDAARRLLLLRDREVVRAEAARRLDSGKAATRTAMVQILGALGDDPAREALRARAAVERTQAVQRLIDQFLGTAPDGPAPTEGGAGYEAADGRWIAIPPLAPLDDGPSPRFGEADLAELRRADAEVHRQRQTWEESRRARGGSPQPAPRTDLAQRIVDLFNGQPPDPEFARRIQFLSSPHLNWIARALGTMPAAKALAIAVQGSGNLSHLLAETRNGPSGWLHAALEQGRLDLRHVLAAAEVARTPMVFEQNYGKPLDLGQGTAAERFLRLRIRGSTWDRREFDLPPEAIWPLVAEHLGPVEEALPPHDLSAETNEAALQLLAELPALPGRMMQPVLLLAIGEAQAPRTLAQKLLAGLPGVDEALIALLGDSRQAVRANAAALLTQRGAREALPALVARLGKEKSEAARAALIAAIARLGGDTEPFLGPEALEAEARALGAKLKAEALGWLPVAQAPALHWADGTPASPTLLDGWLKLALKLREPDNGLLRLYLGQLRPGDASALGDWLLQGWLAFDSHLPPRSEALARAMEQARAIKAHPQHGQHYGARSIEEIAADLLRYQPTVYPNSGSDSKGILALAQRATPVLQARVIAAYLKACGKRVSQAKTLLDLLAGSGSPEAVQVLVATATRFKQRSVREHAEEVVRRLAEARGWSADELADRSIPSGGLEESGETVLEVGEEGRPYRLRLGSDLELRILNPEGREVRSLPAGKDENSKAAKEALSAAKAAVRTVAAQQARRLYEAMLARRAWAIEDWRSDLDGHPIVSRLTERVVWRGLDAEDRPLATFRPTPERDLFDAEGDDAVLEGVVRVDIAHGSLMDEAEAAAWRRHLDDFEVKPLFGQFARPVLRPDDPEATGVKDREGWVLEVLRFRSEATRLGYDKGPAEDGGWVHTYVKAFPSLALVATIGFTGHGQDGENIPVALHDLGFARTEGRRRGALPLGSVPPLLLSECWNDLHDIARKGAFDPDWTKKVGW